MLEIWKSEDGQILDHFHKLIQNKSIDELEIIKNDNHGKLIIGTNFGKIIYYQIIHSKEKPSQIIELLNLQVPYDNAAEIYYISFRIKMEDCGAVLTQLEFVHLIHLIRKKLSSTYIKRWTAR